MTDLRHFVDALGRADGHEGEWRALGFSLGADDEREFTATCRAHHIQCHDTIESQLREWLACQDVRVVRASASDTAAAIARELDAVGGQALAYGRWFYYPWRRAVVHVLPAPAFRVVRSNRNRDKITLDEAARMRQARIGVIGLSVGHAVAMVLAQEGLCGELRLADFDALELSNLNRLRTSLVHLGVAKSVIAAREIAEIDPYLEVKLYQSGVTEDNVDAFLLADGALDVVIEECDSLAVKVLVRERARSHRIPVVMDTNDRGLLDIERFDREPTREIMHGLLGDLDYAQAKNLDASQRMALFEAFFGGRAGMSERFRLSLERLGTELLGASQLSSDVHLGAALVANAVRRILLGDLTRSGRHAIDLQALVAD